MLDAWEIHMFSLELLYKLTMSVHTWYLPAKHSKHSEQLVLLIISYLLWYFPTPLTVTHCAVATDAIIEMIFNPMFEPVQIGAHCDHDIKKLERKLVNGHTWKQSLVQSWTDHKFHNQVCWYWQTDGSCPSNWWTKLSTKLMDKLMEIVTNWWKLCGLTLHKAWDKMMQNLTCKEILTISVECCFFAGLEEEANWLQCAVWMFLL